VLVVIRDFVAFFSQDPGWSPFLSFVDAGAQRSLSRSLLRLLLTGGCLLGLLLPLGRPVNRGRVPWAGLFLLSGLISTALSKRGYAAETEWEIWALLVLFVILVRRTRVEGLKLTALWALYTVCAGVCLHALWIAVPVTEHRLGGVFHHANALSTWTIVALPFLFQRAASAVPDRYLASFLAGAVLTVQLWAGSLTGACILTGFLVSWLLRERSFPTRFGASVGVAVLPVVFNLSGEAFAFVGFPLLALLLLLIAVMRLERENFKVAALFLLSLTAGVAIFSLLSFEGGGRGSRDRSNSLAARLHFYQAAGQLIGEAPLLGQGPAAFPHEYPRYQGSVQFFSRFVHSLPLEFLLGWGVVGSVLGVIAIRELPITTEAAFAWAFAGFAVHCLSGVQSQFPYLLVLVAVGWAVTAPSRGVTRANPFVEQVSRILLTFSLLALLILNFCRLSAAIDHDLASKLYQSGEEDARAFARLLFSSSLLAEPMNGEHLLTVAQLKLKEGDYGAARELARDAIAGDPAWAAPRRVSLLAGPAPADSREVAEAMATDPINYPDFHRLEAEVLFAQGDSARALERLVKKSVDYHPLILNELPGFRAADLDEQLVEFWLLVAILEEAEGRPDRAESAFRRSLFHTRHFLSRYQKMVSFTRERDLQTGPVVGQLLSQITEQIPAE